MRVRRLPFGRSPKNVMWRMPLVEYVIRNFSTRIARHFLRGFTDLAGGCDRTKERAILLMNRHLPGMSQYSQGLLTVGGRLQCV